MLIGKSIQLHYGLKNRNLLKLRSFTRPWRDIPYILQHHDGGPEFLLPEELPTDKSEYAGRKVIFMVRDPRDVFVSSYFQKTKRNFNFEGTIDDYVKERRGGIETILKFYNIWANNRHVPQDFLLIQYEKLHEDTAGEVRRVLNFIGLDQISDQTIEEAVDFCRFDNMRKLEAKNALGTKALAARDEKDTETFKTRKGEVGGYKEYLSGSTLAIVEETIQKDLDCFYRAYHHHSLQSLKAK